MECSERVELKKNVERNCPHGEVEAGLLVWDKGFVAKEKFDVVLVADCLFCAHLHSELLHTILELMHAGSKCLVLAPKRKGTLDKFLALLEQRKGELTYSVTQSVTEEFDKKLEAVKKSPFFKPDEHQPYLITISPSIVKAKS